jgi:hypothetical protein
MRLHRIAASTAAAVLFACVPFTVARAQLDNYHCFKVKDLRTPKFLKTTVALSDVLSTVDAELKKPFLFCLPTSANGSGVNDPSASVCCYKAKGESFPKAIRPSFTVLSSATVDQSGLDLSILKTFLFCEPCSGVIAIP